MDLLFFLIFEDVAQNKTLEYSRNDLLGFLKANNMKKLAQTWFSDQMLLDNLQISKRLEGTLMLRKQKTFEVADRIAGWNDVKNQKYESMGGWLNLWFFHTMNVSLKMSRCFELSPFLQSEIHLGFPLF